MGKKRVQNVPVSLVHVSCKTLGTLTLILVTLALLLKRETQDLIPISTYIQVWVARKLMSILHLHHEKPHCLL